jgi:hypothetical protein
MKTQTNPSDELSANQRSIKRENIPQEQGNTLSIKGNTSPTNHAQARGSMGTQSRQTTSILHGSPVIAIRSTYQSPKQSQWPKAVARVRPNHQFG